MGKRNKKEAVSSISEKDLCCSLFASHYDETMVNKEWFKKKNQPLISEMWTIQPECLFGQIHGGDCPNESNWGLISWLCPTADMLVGGQWIICSPLHCAGHGQLRGIATCFAPCISNQFIHKVFFIEGDPFVRSRVLVFKIHEGGT